MSTGFLSMFQIPPVVRALGIYLFVFGVVTIAGGVMGFVKAQSRASLVAGSISGVLLLVAGWWVRADSARGVFLALLVSLALAVRFGRAFKSTRKLMPAGLILFLSLGAIALSVLALASRPLDSWGG